MAKKIKVTNPTRPKSRVSEEVTIDWSRPQEEIKRIQDLYASAYLESLVEELPNAHRKAVADVKVVAQTVLRASLGLRESFGSWEFSGSDNPLRRAVAEKAQKEILAEIERWLSDGTAVEYARQAQKTALEEYRRTYKDACVRGLRDIALAQAPKDMARLTEGGSAAAILRACKAAEEA